MSEHLQHLVLVRHGEDEGQIRREAQKHGETVVATKPRHLDELTPLGVEQGYHSGLWIKENILLKHNLETFDYCGVSHTLRAEQTAGTLDINDVLWQENPNLNERDRGAIHGLKSSEHRRLYPDSYKIMQNNPLYWVPAGTGGQAIIPHVTSQVEEFMVGVNGAESVLAITHRDWMWAAHLVLEHLSEGELLGINTDDIHCGQIIYYTSINPTTGEQADQLTWKISIDPMNPDDTTGWWTIKQK